MLGSDAEAAVLFHGAEVDNARDDWSVVNGLKEEGLIGGDGAAVAISDVVGEGDITVEVQGWLEGPSAVVVVDDLALPLCDLEVDGTEGVAIGVRCTSEEIALADGVSGVF